jgi:hypothetical protein
MFYGVIAGQAGATGGSDSGGGGGTLPPGALAIADFVNGTYLTTTATLTAADVVSAPGQVASGTGLAIDDTNTVELIGDIAALLLAGDWTIVLAWSKAGSFCHPLHIQDSADDNPRLALEDGASWWLAYDVSGGAGTERDAEDDFAHGTSSVAAITRTDAKLKASYDGRAVLGSSAASSGFAAGINRVLLGGDSSGSYGDMTLKKIVIYPAQDDAALPGLSAG